METIGMAMSKMETAAVAPSQGVEQSRAVATSQEDIQDWQLAAAEEPRRRRRAEAEKDDDRTLTDRRSERLHAIGYISTKLPRYEVLKEWVATTFPDAERKCNPNMLGNGFFEVMFHSSHAKDRALARSPYDLAGTVITLSPWSRDPKKPMAPRKLTPKPQETQRQVVEINGDQPPAVINSHQTHHCHNCHHTFSVSAETLQPVLVEPMRDVVEVAVADTVAVPDAVPHADTDAVANVVTVVYERPLLELEAKVSHDSHKQAEHIDLISHIPTKVYSKYKVAYI